MTVPVELDRSPGGFPDRPNDPQPIQPAVTGQKGEGPARTERSKAKDAIRVLFVDDHQVIRQGLIRMIADQPNIQVVGEAKDGLEAVELVRQLYPDVVVMDVNMPKMGGVEATRTSKPSCPMCG